MPLSISGDFRNQYMLSLPQKARVWLLLEIERKLPPGCCMQLFTWTLVSVHSGWLVNSVERRE